MKCPVAGTAKTVTCPQFHSKTAIADLKAKGAPLSIGGVAGGNAITMPITGTIKVQDFQWPETYGIGLAWQASPKLMLTGDLKRIRWSDSMKDFRLKFEADGGGDLTAVMAQNWKDHTVAMLGGQYMLRPDLALRAGFNYAANPVPTETLNPLFPATVRRHYTVGFGWRMDKDSTLAGSMAYAPRESDTNPNTGITSTHRQTTLRVNYNFSY